MGLVRMGSVRRAARLVRPSVPSHVPGAVMHLRSRSRAGARGGARRRGCRLS